MARYLIRQPNGLYMEWSTVCNNIVAYDCTRKDIINDAVEYYRGKKTRKINEICDQLDRGEIPYHQFTMTLDEAVDRAIEVNGEDDYGVGVMKKIMGNTQ